MLTLITMFILTSKWSYGHSLQLMPLNSLALLMLHCLVKAWLLGSRIPVRELVNANEKYLVRVLFTIIWCIQTNPIYSTGVSSFRIRGTFNPNFHSHTFLRTVLWVNEVIHPSLFINNLCGHNISILCIFLHCLCNQLLVTHFIRPKLCKKNNEVHIL